MPRRSAVTLLSAFVAAAALAAPCRAQDTPKPETAKVPEVLRPAERRVSGVMLRVQVVISRFQGERKLGSLPYTFNVTVEGRPVRVRMGVETPVAVATSPDKGIPAMTSFQYKNVGTNIDCSAREVGSDGRYQLMLTVENSSVAGGAESSGQPAAQTPAAPLFRTFNANLDPVLRDGQSVQAIASTDPVTGEVVKVDVTLNVVK
jgi:hypothetical protein